MARQSASTPEAKILAGTFRPDRHANAPEPNNGVPECPDWLSEKAKEKWNQLAPQLEEVGLLDNIDGGLFAIYVDSLARYEEVTKRIQSIEDCVDPNTKSGYVQLSALFNVRSKLVEQITKISRAFGIGPLARGNSSLGGAIGKERRSKKKDEWEDF